MNARFTEDSPRVPIRLVASNPTGHVLRIDAYAEAADPETQRVVFTSIDARPQQGENLDLSLLPGRVGELDGQEVTVPYPVINRFDLKRAQALMLTDTLYVYDFIDLFERSLEVFCVDYPWG